MEESEIIIETLYNIRNMLDDEEGYKLLLCLYRLIILERAAKYRSEYSNENTGSLQEYSFIKDMSDEHIQILSKREQEHLKRVLSELEKYPPFMEAVVAKILLIMIDTTERELEYGLQELKCLENIYRLLNGKNVIGEEDSTDLTSIVKGEDDVERVLREHLVYLQTKKESEMLVDLVNNHIINYKDSMEQD